MKTTLSTTTRCLLFVLVLPLAGCGLGQVKPWERGMLAEEKMQLVPSAVENALDEHIYFSKEASFGGQGIGGGGCGCN